MERELNDRTGWLPGPWDSEPDQEQWITGAGLPGLLIRNRFGCWCGYVGTSPQHPNFGLGYDDVDVNVHGGLTFAGHPIAGDPDETFWWFGFDCNHGGDYSPELDRHYRQADFPPLERQSDYRTIEYAKRQVESMAEQLQITMIEFLDPLFDPAPELPLDNPDSTV